MTYFHGKEGGLVVDYIGIARALKEAMHDYTGRDRQNFGNPDIKVIALVKFREKLEVCRGLFHGFDHSHFRTGTDADRALLIKGGVNFMLAVERQDDKTLFVREATLLHNSLTLCRSLLDEAQRFEVAFYEAVRTSLTRIVGKGRVSKKEINTRIAELLKQSIKSDGVVNLFSDVKSEFSLFDAAFLDEIAHMKERNIAIELLKKLLAERVTLYKRTNLVQAEKFSELLNMLLSNYLKGMLSNEEVIEQLLGLAREIADSEQQGNDLGLTAVNITMPLTSFFFSVAVMIVSGGVVICGIAQGQNDRQRMRGYTTLTLVVLAVTCVLLSVVVLAFLREVCYALGCDDDLYPYVRDYLSVFALLLFFYVSPAFTEAFVRLCHKPRLVFVSGCISCVTNIILDAVLVLGLGWGMRGAAIATVAASCVSAAVLASHIELGRRMGGWSEIRRIFFNGSSELVTCIASSVTTYIFNLYLMRHVGYMGVAALTIVFYLNMVVNFSTLGMAQALYPLIARNLGARNIDHIRQLLRVSMAYSFAIGLGFFVVVLLFREPIVGCFTNGNAELSEMACQAAAFMVPAYLISFVNIIGSSFHTAIEKPLESAVIAVCKSLVFVLIPLLLLPGVFAAFGGEERLGIWLSIPVGELLCLSVTLPLMFRSMRGLQRMEERKI